MTTVIEEPLVYRRAGAARRLQISIDTLDRLIQSGKLRAFKITGSVFVSAEELQRFVHEHEKAGA